MKLKLARADFSFPLLPHDHVLDSIAMLDTGGVDLGLFAGRSHRWPSKAFRNVGRSAARISTNLSDRRLLADVFLQPAAGFPAMAVNDRNPARRKESRDVFLKALEFASRCGGKHASILPGFTRPTNQGPTR